jgi:hypothetical protein
MILLANQPSGSAVLIELYFVATRFFPVVFGDVFIGFPLSSPPS